MKMETRTRRWTRSPRGKLFGVVTGLAEWRGLPPDTTRLIVFLITVFTAVFPAAIIYLLLAVILPEQTPDDIISGDRYTRSTKSSFRREYAEDATFREKRDDDLEKEYENLKKKVETMENDIYDKEKDWDNRFKNS